MGVAWYSCAVCGAYAPFRLMLRFPVRLLARLSVGRKLLLIYLLDLSAVIFISGILINEKFIAIDFARKEIVGNAYIAYVRDALIDVAGPRSDGALPGYAQSIAGLETAQREFGSGIQSDELRVAFARAMARLSAADKTRAEPGGRAALVTAAMDHGRALLTRVGNQSNLILDPDLDSYYTMSLLLLRFPEVLEIVTGIAEKLHWQAVSGQPIDGLGRTQYFIVEERLDAIAKGIEADYSEAFAASTAPALRAALDPSREALAGAIEAFRAAARDFVATDPTPAQWTKVESAQQALLAALRASWFAAASELDVLLRARVHGFFVRM